VDVSSGMVALARSRHPELRFELTAAEHAEFGRTFDYIVLSDLLPVVDELLRLRRRTPLRNWVTPQDVDNLLRLAGLEPVTEARRILLPARIPFLSGFCNGFLANLPVIRHLCLTYWIVARLQPAPEPRELSASVLVP